jgi:hypothetical protein
MVLICLVFWAVTLPLAGLVEVGVLLAHQVQSANPSDRVAPPAA